LAYRVTLRIRSLNGLSLLFNAIDRLMQHYGTSEPWLDVVRIDTEPKKKRRRKPRVQTAQSTVAKLLPAAGQPRIDKQ
jgi:hypothetical protein